jgi:hypothetical protein
MESWREVLLLLHDCIDNCEGIVHQSRITRTIGGVHFVSMKQIVSNPPDSVQKLRCRVRHGCVIAKLGPRVVLNE